MSRNLRGPGDKAQFRIRTGTSAELGTLQEIDADASELFVQAGLDLDLPEDHEFVIAERTRWLSSLASGRALVAVDPSGIALGFVASGVRDAGAFIQQLSVRHAAMGMGIGSALLTAAERTAHQSGARALWLTTYRHLPWNRPFYERRGFSMVPEPECGREVRAELAFERRWLPAPHQRVAMMKALSIDGGYTAR